MNDSQKLVSALAKSNLFLRFQEAFTETMGLPLGFEPVESWHLPLHRKKNESLFCAMMAGQSHSCAYCLQVRQKLSQGAVNAPCTLQCGAGLWESAVPVRTGEKLIGFLHTGQAFDSQPTAARLDKTAKLAGKLGLEVDVEAVKHACFSAAVVPPARYAAGVRLLASFAGHLSLLASQIAEQERVAEPPVITRAKRFIHDNFKEDISLADTAKACNMSLFYFCKLFTRETGVNFTAYLNGVRIEKAKNLLLNHNLNISEIAYEVGFQSLTHFNRVFKKLAGESPTRYRERLPGKSAA